MVLCRRDLDSQAGRNPPARRTPTRRPRRSRSHRAPSPGLPALRSWPTEAGPGASGSRECCRAWPGPPGSRRGDKSTARAAAAAPTVAVPSRSLPLSRRTDAGTQFSPSPARSARGLACRTMSQIRPSLSQKRPSRPPLRPVRFVLSDNTTRRPRPPVSCHSTGDAIVGDLHQQDLVAELATMRVERTILDQLELGPGGEVLSGRASVNEEVAPVEPRRCRRRDRGHSPTGLSAIWQEVH